MSNATLKEKIIIQAQTIFNLNLDISYLIQELYKLKPDHEFFTKNPETVEEVKRVMEAQKKAEKALAEQEKQCSPE